MTDKNIRRLALVTIGAGSAGCWALAVHFQSIAWTLVAAWLAFTLVAETWPRRDS